MPVGFTMSDKAKNPIIFLGDSPIKFGGLFNDGENPYEIVLIGDTISKKNSPQIVYPKQKEESNKKPYPFIIPSNAYKKWHKKNVDYLNGKHYLIDWNYPIQLSIQFFRASKRSFDYNNMGQGVQDVLVDVGIVRDDSINDLVPVFLPARIDRENPRCEITIIELDSYWKFNEV